MSRGVVGGTALGFGDLCATMAAIEEHHQVTVDLTLTVAPGKSRAGHWSVCATERGSLACPVDLSRPQRRWVLTADDLGDLGRTCSMLYRLLLTLDHDLTSERWAQMPLPEG